MINTEETNEWYAMYVAVHSLREQKIRIPNGSNPTCKPNVSQAATQGWQACTTEMGHKIPTEQMRVS